MVVLLLQLLLVVTVVLEAVYDSSINPNSYGSGTAGQGNDGGDGLVYPSGGAQSYQGGGGGGRLLVLGIYTGAGGQGGVVICV